MEKNNTQEQWVEEAFESVRGLKPATPDVALLENIKASIASQHAMILSVSQVRSVAAAAVFLLFCNIYFVSHYNQPSKFVSEADTIEDYYSNTFTSSYKLYE